LRTDDVLKNMVTIKHMIMNLIRSAAGKDSLKSNRKTAEWNHDDLRALITQTAQWSSSDWPVGWIGRLTAGEWGCINRYEVGV